MTNLDQKFSAKSTNEILARAARISVLNGRKEVFSLSQLEDMAAEAGIEKTYIKEAIESLERGKSARKTQIIKFWDVGFFCYKVGILVGGGFWFDKGAIAILGGEPLLPSLRSESIKSSSIIDLPVDFMFLLSDSLHKFLELSLLLSITFYTIQGLIIVGHVVLSKMVDGYDDPQLHRQ
jgi:hypothetical protein